MSRKAYKKLDDEAKKRVLDEVAFVVASEQLKPADLGKDQLSK
jgi:hypothetical protein